jgi:hypothetical protein
MLRAFAFPRDVSGWTFDHASVDPANPPRVAICSGDCPKHAIEPVIDRASAEVDPTATSADGTQRLEQLWISYYASDGTVANDVRLVNDATTGWNDDHGTDWTPPSEPTPAHLWAVVHDNRGGMSWTELDVVAE